MKVGSVYFLVKKREKREIVLSYDRSSSKQRNHPPYSFTMHPFIVSFTCYTRVCFTHTHFIARFVL